MQCGIGGGGLSVPGRQLGPRRAPWQRAAGATFRQKDGDCHAASRPVAAMCADLLAQLELARLRGNLAQALNGASTSDGDRAQALPSAT